MNKKLSILIYSLASGGAERVVSILLWELKDKFDITLVLMNNSIFYDIPQDIDIVYIENSNPNESGIKKILKLPILAYRYSKIKSDISISFMNRPNYINILSNMIKNSRTIISERATPSIQHRHGLQGRINRFLIKFLYPKSDIVIANSLGNKMDLKQNFNIDNVVTLNNPFDIAKIENMSNQKVNIKNDKFTFITIGRLDSGKNHQLLINAIKNIDAYLYIIGDGYLKSNLKKQIIDLKLDNKVFLLGRQNNPYKYLSKADCFIFSSNYEGFPNVLLEALACGLPIISTDCSSGPREILAPDTDITKRLKDNTELAKYGILVPINNQPLFTKAMEDIIKNKSLRDNYTNIAKNRAKDFNKEKIVDKLCELLLDKNTNLNNI